MRRNDRAVTTKPEILDILTRCEVMRLGLCANNRPYVVPMNFGIEDTVGAIHESPLPEGHDNAGLAIYFHCATQGRKLDILAQNPNVCFEADCSLRVVEKETACSWTAQYESVIGEGIVTILTDPAAKTHGLDCIMQKYGFQGMPTYSPEALARVCVLRLDVTEICGKRNL